MIDTIILHIGSAFNSPVISDFFYQYRDELRKENVLYAESLNGPLWPEGASRHYWNSVKDDYPSLLAHLGSISRGSSSSAIQETLFLSWEVYFLNLDYLLILQSACKKIFPQARCKVLLFFGRQDHELDLGFRTELLRTSIEFPLDHYLPLRQNILPDYKKIVNFLYSHWDKRDILPPLSNLTSDRYKDSILTLCAALDLPQQKTCKFVENFLPRTSLYLPREVAIFSGITNMGFRPRPGSLIRWAPYAQFFTSASGYKGTPHSLYGPNVHSKILEEFSASNMDAAELLEVPSLFSDLQPDPEPDWEPWTGLTPDVAYKIAERLPSEFVAMLREPFETKKLLFLNRDQRICYQSLLEVSASAGGRVAFPRQFHEKPAKVAVLTLTYNHGNFIEKNIKSVLEQKTDFPIEHIIADDASTDGTREIILKYAEKYPHIIPVFQEQRSGGCKNLEALFSMAKSPYVALCEGDDFFSDPHKLQKQADYLDTNPGCAICFHPVRVTYEDEPDRERIYPTPEAFPRGIRERYYLTDIIQCNFIQSNSVMYRWRFADGLPAWFRSNLLPGDWYWHLLHAETGWIGYIDQIMSVYRRHAKGVYYIAESNSQRFHFLRGAQELAFYDEINKHFKGAYNRYVQTMASGVLADMYLYGNEIGDLQVFEDALLQYPVFAKIFFDSISKNN